MILLIYRNDVILLQTFKITLNLSSKKHETLTENPPIQIYPNKIKKRIVFKIKRGYKLELLTPETMRLLGSTKKMLIKIKTAKTYQNQNLLKLFQFIVILVKNDFQRTSKVLFSFVPNKQFGQFINFSAHSLTIMNTGNTEFSSVQVWFTEQASPFEINVSLTLIIGQTL